jgi:hypothetical protein
MCTQMKVLLSHPEVLRSPKEMQEECHSVHIRPSFVKKCTKSKCGQGCVVQVLSVEHTRSEFC